MRHTTEFPYDLAFDRNLGLLTEWEQLSLRGKRVAIAGMGGVGGVHLLTLVRLGIGAFTIADFDEFEFANFNRQIGATMSSLGRNKAHVLAEMAIDINPTVRIRCLDSGVTCEGIDKFLRGADLFVDGLDFFALSIRRRVFSRCAELGIPALTAAPIGMGVAFIAFDPKGMSFERYFGFEGQPTHEQYIRFLVGLTPRQFHRHYIVDATRIDLARHRGPSTVAACQLCAGVTAVAVLKLLLGRGGLDTAPANYQFDPYRGRFSVTRLRFGNNGPLQRVKIAIGRRLYDRLSSDRPASERSEATRSVLEEILNLARWAPSKGNTQPWKFKILGPDQLLVRIDHRAATSNPERKALWLSIGMLLESMRLAATGWHRELVWDQKISEDQSTLNITFKLNDDVDPDPLLSYLPARSVDRRPYRFRPLSEREKIRLQASLPADMTLVWQENLLKRWRFARLAALTKRSDGQFSPRKFAMEQQSIDWDHPFSLTGVPAQTVGLGISGLSVLRWAMKGRWHVTGVGRIATLFLDIKLEYLPVFRSAGCFVVHYPKRLVAEWSHSDLINIGGHLQRLWLTATSLGLRLQPMWAVLHAGNFEEAPTDGQLQKKRGAFLDSVLGGQPETVVFAARIGEPYPRLPTSRASRLPVVNLTD